MPSWEKRSVPRCQKCRRLSTFTEGSLASLVLSHVSLTEISLLTLALKTGLSLGAWGWGQARKRLASRSEKIGFTDRTLNLRFFTHPDPKSLQRLHHHNQLIEIRGFYQKRVGTKLVGLIDIL